MWSFRRTATADDTIRFMLDNDGWPASRRQALEAFVRDESLREQLRTVLMEAPFSAFRWETPSLTETSADAPFEFVLIDHPPLDRLADAAAFAEHFTDETVATFSSLRGDATLIVPRPLDEYSNYSHLAAFVRTAPPEQYHRLLQTVAVTILNGLSEDPIWLSTAGMGVAWLHVRLDSRPKYYAYAPYMDH